MKISLAQASEAFRGKDSEENLHSLKNAYSAFLFPIREIQEVLPDDIHKHQENIQNAFDNKDLDTSTRISLFFAAHNYLQGQKDEILSRIQKSEYLSQIPNLKEDIIKRYDTVTATVHRAYNERPNGNVRNELLDFYTHLKEHGFQKPFVHNALFHSPVSQHIESMWHNSNRTARERSLDTVIMQVVSQYDDTKNQLIFSVYDDAGGFADTSEVRDTPPKSTTNGGLGLSNAYKDVMKNNGFFLRHNQEDGAVIHLGYPVKYVNGTYIQK